MSPPPHPSRVDIPESLHRQLVDFRKHLWRVKILEALAAGLLGLILSFLLVFGLDRIFATPGWLRLLILLGGVSLFTVFAPYWLYRWVWRQRRENQLARLIAKRYPGLGDRLLGVIELQNQQEDAGSLSPRLRQAAMEVVAAETGRRNLIDALPPQRHRMWMLAVMVLATAATALFVLTPRATLNALHRWLLPFSETGHYTFTRLENPPTYRAVAFGESFDIVLKLAKDSEQRPARALARYGMQPAVSSDLKKQSYTLRFPGQQDPGVVTFRIGDLRHDMRVEPIQRPSATAVNAMVKAPDYLQIPDRSTGLNSGVISLVEGSTIRIDLETNRPLATGTYGPTRAVLSDGNADVTTHQSSSGKLIINGTHAHTSTLPIGEVPFEIPFDWQDHHGLSGTPGFRLRVEPHKDAPPICYLQGMDRIKVMLPEETFDFEVLAEDDYGLKWVGIEWTGQQNRPTGDDTAQGELRLATGSQSSKRMLEPAAFSPKALGIGPQKIMLRGYTEDHFPNRGRIRSEPLMIHILTRDEHAQMLKNRFDRNITELEDLARRELNLLDENQRLEKLDGSALQKEENRKRLDQQEREENETARRMEALRQNMEQLLKDAARNEEIEKKTLQKIAEAIKPMQELADQDIPEVRDNLAESKEPSNTPEKSKQDLAEAVEQQKSAVEKMREAINKANEANQQFEAGTFANRLKKAAADQSGIVSNLKDKFENLLGVTPRGLDPSYLRNLNEYARQQMTTASDVRWIQEDLGHFYVRSQNEEFREVMDLMRESGIEMGLETIRMRLTDNHSFEAAEESRKWAEQLTEWARKLSGDQENGGGGGGGGGAPDAENEDFEFMLRVMKMIQQEQDLRGRTRVLEQLRRDAGNPPTTPKQP